MFLVLSILGFANSLYLVWKHYQKKPLVCPLNHDCNIVTESRWSSVFGIRNEVLGAVFFALLLDGVILLFLLPTREATILFLFLMGTGGSLLFSLFLLYLQIFVIKDYCFYCLLSALITLFLFANSILLNNFSS
ncbi:hypothetical protein HY496_00175 [Candidatus Woesearchaeota archaeon]|nr:hypothetical protein [Candidatus Woesearchaeota archaeon]